MQSNRFTLRFIIFRNNEQKQVVEFDEGDGVTNRIVMEDEEEEREDIAEL